MKNNTNNSKKTYKSALNTTLSAHNVGINNYVEWVKNYDNALSVNDTLDMNISNFKTLTEEEQKAMKAIADAMVHANVFSSYRYSECPKEEQKAFMQAFYTVRNLVCQNVWDVKGSGWDFKDIYGWIKDSAYANIPKTKRRVMYSSINPSDRPTGASAYIDWNGFQVIDLDIKNEKVARILKPMLFDMLATQHWFVGITMSTSGNGIHIWTKITPKTIHSEKRRIEFRINFRQKYSYVYCALESISYSMIANKDKYGLTEDEICFDTMKHWIDMAMCKPQQGTFIPFDPTAELCTNFIDTALDCNFDTMLQMGEYTVDWVEREDLKVLFEKLQYFSDDERIGDEEVSKDDVDDKTDPNRPRVSTAKHYKHQYRWQLANTLCSIYGADQGYQYLRQICLDTPSSELLGDIKTAKTYNKPISRWAIRELNAKHGFKLVVKSDTVEDINEIAESDENTQSPTSMLGRGSTEEQMHLTKDQYLSDIQDQIVNGLSSMTLLEAGAGYGKTEMVKRLPGRVMLVVPYTSIIKSKVEADKNIKDSWLYYYGSKSMDREGLLSGRSMVMTIDKFSKLNIYDIMLGGFDYVIIDESHLLFTSSYRSVMGSAIKRMANIINKTKIVMMTGTPTGELLFFPVCKHIKVDKEETRQKNFDIHFCHAKDEVQLEMCKDIAESIKRGKHILLPTNKGNDYFTQVCGLVQDQLNKDNFGREIKTFYYKKSNSGTADMEKINMDKSVGENDIIACTNYLSVGVDICDKYDFEVYFCETWMPQDIEQFTNRLRNNDLHIRMYLPEVDQFDLPIDYNTKRKLTLRFDKQELIKIYNLVQTCNDMIERNGYELTYNPAIKAILEKQNYIKYDENLCKYYIDETAYKLGLFEKQYGDYIKQVPLIISSMKYYGYKVNIVHSKNALTEDQRENFKDYVKECKRTCVNNRTTETFIFLDTLTDANIDIYKQIVRGNYEFLRSKEYENDRLNNNIYTRDIEVIEKNMPYITTFNKWYDFDTIKDIYKACTETKSNKISKTKLDRIKQFAIIESQRIKKRLDLPLYKFISDSWGYAGKGIVTTQADFDTWLAEWTCNYCNSIDGLVIQKDDEIDGKKSGSRSYIEQMNETFRKLFKVLFNMTKHKKTGELNITPYKLLWSKKQSLDNMYNTDANINAILANDLIVKMSGHSKEELEEELNHDEDMDNLSQKTQEELNNYKFKQGSRKTESNFNEDKKFTEGYDYGQFATEDSSNQNFLIKQEKEYEILTGGVSKTVIDNTEEASTITETKTEHTLFDDDYITEQEEINKKQPLQPATNISTPYNAIPTQKLKKNYSLPDNDDSLVAWDIVNQQTGYFDGGGNVKTTEVDGCTF